MATVTGMICDVCERFAVTRTGWMRLTTDADKDNKGFDVCSNPCLKKLATSRMRGEAEIKASSNGNPNLGQAAKNAPKQDPNKPTAKDYSHDEKLAIALEAIETSVFATAQKYGLPWQAVARWKTENS